MIFKKKLNFHQKSQLINNFSAKNITRILFLFLLLNGLFSSSAIAQPLAANKDKFVGNVIGNAFSIRSNFMNYWNQVTAENAGKWSTVQSSANG